MKHGTPLHRLIHEGRCYRNERHGFVVCTTDSPSDRFPKGPGPFLVGRDGELHLTGMEGLTTRGKGVAVGFKDARRHSFTRPMSPNRPFIETVSAPAYVRFEDQRFLACGRELHTLVALSPADSRALLKKAELFVDPPSYDSVMRRAEDGTFVVLVRREGGGLPSVRELYLGKQGRVRLVKPTREDMVRDGGSRLLELPAGGSIFIPVNLSIAGGTPEKFRGGTFKLRAGAPEQDLHVVSDAERRALEEQLGIVNAGPSGRLAPCSAALGS